MKLLYVQEHLTCEKYENSKEPLFENLFIKEGEILPKKVEEAELIFVMDGCMHITLESNELIYPKDTIVLLPPATDLKIRAASDLTLVVLHIKAAIHLCDIQPLEKLYDEHTTKSVTGCSLPMNEAIKDFISLLSLNLQQGLRCKSFVELKSKEVFYYFRAYYEKETLREFFAPLLTRSYEFSIFVMQNYKKAKTVQQFADLYGYSLSCFEKQFKKIFRMSAYQWMTKKKSEEIYHDLIYTNASLIELSDEYGFSSLSQFCDFCKRVFGTSPGKIRNSKTCINNLRK